MTGNATATRRDYVDLFPSLSDAIEHENAVLSIGDEYLPVYAIDVREERTEPTDQYWAWLIGQVTGAPDPDDSEGADYETCEGCGHLENHCKCDEEVDGYECSECGHVPTRRELDRGWCPRCNGGAS